MRRATSSVAAALVLSYAAPAHADPVRTIGGDAEALFYEARALMKEGKHSEACPKLEQSLRLEYGIGTEYNLADCNEQIGKLATAWSGFVNVAAAAQQQGQHERERIARERARALESRLPRLAIDVTPRAVEALEVFRDETAVDEGSWGTSVPVDPGWHTVRVAAQGRKPWQATIFVAEGESVRVPVPPELEPLSSAPAVLARPEPARVPDFPDPIVEPRGTAQRTLGWILAGVGAAGLGVGAGFGLDSLQRGNRSKDHCDGDLCDARGLELREQAIDSGNVATVATIAGGAALAGGLVLVLTAPRSSPRDSVSRATVIRTLPRVARSGGGIWLEGVLP